MSGERRILDAARGCLLGGAAGDALGYAVEFLCDEQIRRIYGERGIVSYRLSDGLARVSDDTQMTLFTAEGLLLARTTGALLKSLSASYQNWLLTQTASPEAVQRDGAAGDSKLLRIKELYARRAPGNTCLSALAAGNPAADDPLLRRRNNSKGCGGVMRVAPVALDAALREKLPVEEIDRAAARAAAITHGHSLGFMPAATLCHILRRIVFRDSVHAPLKEIVLEARDATVALFSGDPHLPELTTLIDDAVARADNAQNDSENIRALGEGWVAEETLAIAIYCALRYQDDFSSGLFAAVNHDGDSDSTGAVAGNILGARIGYNAIDAMWKTDLELKDVILETADALVAPI